MSQLLRESINVNSDILNLLEHKCCVLNFALPNNIYWWPAQECCIVSIGLDYESVRSTSEITVRRLIAEYEWGGESNNVYVLGSGTGLLPNLLDTPISELSEPFTMMIYDLFTLRNNDQPPNLTQRDLQLQEEGGVRVGSEEFHPSDAQIAAEMFAQE